MQVGLFFGSFNPIHVGHLLLANYMLEYTPLEEIWFVVSPQSPFKTGQTLLSESDRLHLVRLAIEGHKGYRACDIEFSMPRPSYTFDTLVKLVDKYRGKEFSLVMSEELLGSFHKWKNSDAIRQNFHRYVYPRLDGRIGQDFDWKKENATYLADAPVVGISASMIRKAIREGKNMPFFMPERVYNYVREMHFFEK